MKMVYSALIVVLAFSLGVGVVGAAEQASLEKGKALFNNVNLGTVGKSCNSCHADGKGLEKAGANADLAGVVNTCITKGLHGTALKVDSADMQSMVLYIKSFGSKKPAEKKKAAVGC